MSIADKLTTIAEKIQKVFDAGKKSAYDEFWDKLQNNGKRTEYSATFGAAWNSKIFKPKYDMKPTFAGYMFNCSKVSNLKDVLEKQGVTLDFSDCTSFLRTFQYSGISALPKIDMSKCNNSESCFGAMHALTSLDLVVSQDTVFSSNTFITLPKVTHLSISGTIGKKLFNVKDSPKLDKESITSIINALSDTTSGLTVTLSKTAVNNAFGIDIDDENTYPEGSEFYTLRNSKKNWTISYA